MTSVYGNEAFIVETVVTVVGTGDKLTYRAPADCIVTRWGIVVGPLGLTGAMVLTGDVLPRTAGTRVDGATSGGFDTAGGTISPGAIAAGQVRYHEPKFDPSGAVASGTNVGKFGNQLYLNAGDSFIIEATTAGATDTTCGFFVEIRQSSFQPALQTANVVKI